MPTVTGQRIPRLWWVWIGLAVAFTLAVAANITVAAVTAPTAKMQERSQPIATGPIPQVRDAIRLDVGQLLAVNYNGRVLTVRWQVGNTLTAEFVRQGAWLDTIDILKGVHQQEAGVASLRSVRVVGTFPTRQASGRVNPFERVLDLTYTRATLDRINYATLPVQRIFDLSQPGRFIAPEMRSTG